MNLHIFYLHYDATKFEKRSRDPQKQRPSWFSYDLCLLNFLKSLNGNACRGRLSFTLWYDGSIDELRLGQDIATAIETAQSSGIEVKVIAGDFGSGSKSGYNLQNYIVQQDSILDDDLVYTLENDYLHQPDWLKKVDELYHSEIQYDYISLYDHGDNYRLPIHRKFTSEIFATKNHIWRTCFSTCYSKLSRGRTMREDLPILTRYDDFLAFSLMQLKGRKLVVSIPGLSTHAMAGLESPAVDWEKIAAGTV